MPSSEDSSNRRTNFMTDSASFGVSRHQEMNMTQLNMDAELFDGNEGASRAVGRRARHPARFSDTILGHLNAIVPSGVYLDPFAGTGRVHELQRSMDLPDGTVAKRETVGIEIQPQWAALHPQTQVGNALHLPEDWTGRFDGIITSPCYGNRFADHHRARDASSRRSYTHDLQTMTGDPTLQLEPDNAGTLYFWELAYESFHRCAWTECHRVTRPDGVMFLNVSDFIHEGEKQPVVALHARLLTETGWALYALHHIETPRLRYGQNSDARVDNEVILVARRL
jgi:hypothetical protein